MSEMSPTERFAAIRACLTAAQEALDAAVAAGNRVDAFSGHPDMTAFATADEQWEEMDAQVARLLSLTEVTEGQQLLGRIAAWLAGQEISERMEPSFSGQIAAGSGAL